MPPPPLTRTRSIPSIEQLERMLSEPTVAVVEMMRRLPGDLILLRLGPSSKGNFTCLL